MKLRFLTALPLALGVSSLLWWGPEWLFTLVLLASVEISLYEFFGISRQAGFRPLPAVGYAAGVLVCLAQVPKLPGRGSLLLAALALAVLLVIWIGLHRTRDLKDYLGTVSTTIFGIIYIPFALSWLVPLRLGLYRRASLTGRQLVFLLFLVVWAGDIFAYLGGRSLGRTPLAPRISPKKTVEGAATGFAGSLLVAWLFVLWQTADLKTVMLLAALVALAGQVGDLVESALKRGADLKDSGTLLPGHGGLLDRIDSLLFGVPAMWLAVTLTDAFK